MLCKSFSCIPLNAYNGHGIFYPYQMFSILYQMLNKEMLQTLSGITDERRDTIILKTLGPEKIFVTEAWRARR